MGKYEQLRRHLREVDSDARIEMTFEQVARWVPGGLPSSAFRNPRWWTNEPSGSHAQAWIESGWEVASVDLTDRSVTFERAPKDALNGIQQTSVEAMEQLAGFLGSGHVSGLLHHLAGELDGADAASADGAAAEAGFTPKLLSEAVAVRRHLGRLNDLIHAAAMTMALPQILEPDEVVAQRPWLAADGDPAHTFDLETDRRVADFKLAVWTGKDATRKRGLFQGLVHLAAQPPERRPELYVAGEAPLRFLRSSRSNAAWGLSRGPESAKVLYLERFQDLGLSICDFTQGPAAHVRLVNLAQVLPPMQTALTA